jgi:hypothetical protein
MIPNGGGIVQSGDFAVTQTTVASMAVQVGVGRIWLPGTNTANLAGQSYSPQGMYFALNDGPITAALAPSNSANPRIDVVYVAVKDSAFGAAADQIYIGVVTGAAASTPAVPALPTGVNATSLAQVAVAANASSVINANITATAPPILARPPVVSAVISPNPTYWTPFGNLAGVPVGSQTQWSGYIQLTRASTTLAISTTAYTDLGAALPVNARVGYGSVQYLRGIITGGAVYTACTVFLNCQTGDVQVRADNAVTMAVGSFIAFQTTYLQ